MADWKKLLIDVLLADGAIDTGETKYLRDEIMEDGVVDEEEVDFLVSLRNGAKELCPEFNGFFFAALESNVLADGVIDAAEAARLREILFADGVIDDNEKAFLRSLKSKARETGPEFNALFEQCMK